MPGGVQFRPELTSQKSARCAPPTPGMSSSASALPDCQPLRLTISWTIEVTPKSRAPVPMLIREKGAFAAVRGRPLGSATCDRM